MEYELVAGANHCGVCFRQAYHYYVFFLFQAMYPIATITLFLPTAGKNHVTTI